MAHITLQVPGEHNVKDSIAAAAASLILGIPGNAIAQGLKDFRAPAAGLSLRVR